MSWQDFNNPYISGNPSGNPRGGPKPPRPLQPTDPRNNKTAPPTYYKNFDTINTYFRDFLGNDFNQLDETIKSGVILNERNEEGKTLIHATIENSILNEEEKLQIIKELVTKANVSPNFMDKFNRTPLHYAASKGYFDIVQYLVDTLKCKINVEDNDGTTPLHLLVNNFIINCENGELLDNTHSNKPNTQADDELSTDFTKFFRSKISKIINEEKDNPDSNLRENISRIENIVKLNKFFKMNEINNIFVNNYKEINVDLSTGSDFTTKINSNIQKTQSDIKSLYDDFKISEQSNQEIQENIIKNQNDILSNINKKITEAYDIIDKIDNSVSNGIPDCSTNNYLSIFNIVYYLFYLLSSSLRLTNSRYIFPQEKILYYYLTGNKLDFFYPGNPKITNDPNNPKKILFPNSLISNVGNKPNEPPTFLDLDTYVLNEQNIRQLDPNHQITSAEILYNYIMDNSKEFEFLKVSPEPSKYTKGIYQAATATAAATAAATRNKAIYDAARTAELNLYIKTDAADAFIEFIYRNKIPVPNFFSDTDDFPNPEVNYFAKSYYHVNNVGYPIVNNYDDKLDINSKYINPIDSDLIHKYITEDEYKNETLRNKFYIKHIDYLNLFSKNLGIINIDGTSYEITADSTDMSINKSLLNIILDQLEKLFIPLSKKFSYFDNLGNLINFEQNIDEDQIYSKININPNSNSMDLNFPNIGLKNNILDKGIPLIKLSKTIPIQYENDIIKQEYLYLLSSFNKENPKINEKNIDFLKNLLDEKNKKANINYINPALIKSDLIEFIKLNKDLIERGNTNCNLFDNNLYKNFKKLFYKKDPSISEDFSNQIEKIITQLMVLYPNLNFPYKDNSNLIEAKQNYNTNLEFNDFVNYKKQEFAQILKDTNFGDDDINLKNMNYILSLTIVEILEKNLTNGILKYPSNRKSGNSYDFDSKKYCQGHIYSIFNLIKANLKIIKENYLKKPEGIADVMKMSIPNFTGYFTQIYQLVINNFNNIILADFYIQEAKSSNSTFESVVNNIDQMLLWINDQNIISQESKDLIKTHFKLFWTQAKENLNSIMKFNKLVYEEQLETFYKLNIELINKLKEIAEEYEKFHSILFLEGNFNYFDTKTNQIIRNTFYNLFVFPNKFPENFKDFVDKYGPNKYDLSNYSLGFALDLFPIYYDFNYNNIFTDKNQYVDLKTINSIITTKNEKPYKSSISKNKMYLEKTNKFKTSIHSFKITNFTWWDWKKRSNKEIKVNNICNNKFNNGYFLFFTDTSRLFELRTSNDKYIEERLKKNLPESNKIYKPILDNWEIESKPEYNIVQFICKGNLQINDDPSSYTIVSLYNAKELLQLIFNNFAIQFIKSNGTTLLNEFKENLNKKLNKSTIEEQNKLYEYIVNNKDIQIELLKSHIVDYFNLIIQSKILNEITDITNGFIKKIDIVKEKPNLEIVTLDFNKKLKKKTFNQIASLPIDTNVIETLNIKLGQNNLVVPSTNKRIYGNKCVNTSLVNKFNTIFKNINLREEDKNGNTILNKLIDQFNIEAIKKILQLDPGLPTFLNLRKQNSTQYIFYKIKNEIQNEYYNKLNSRIKQYSQVLQNEINKNEEKFGNINLEETGLVFNLIINSIYMFNEFIWVQMLNFPGQWTLDNKIKLNELLNINDDDEQLLIRTFNSKMQEEMFKDIESNSNEAYLKNERLETLKKNLADINNKIAQLEQVETTGLGLVNRENITTLIDKNIKNKAIIEKSIKEIENLNIKPDILPNFVGIIGSTELITNGSINYEKYDELVQKFKNFYYLILLTLNNSLKNNSNKLIPCISNAQLKIINLNYENFNNKETLDLLYSYFSNVINTIYAEFEDFEKFADIEYNTVNQSMLNIIKINITNVIGRELFNLLIKYTGKSFKEIKENLTKDTKKSIDMITDPIKKEEAIKAETEKQDKMFQEIENKIFEDISELLKASINEKLQVVNPDNIVNNTDILTNQLIQDYNINLNPDQLVEPDNQELTKIILFYKTIGENIALNIYMELQKLLSSLKQISLLLEIAQLINKK